MLRCWHVRRPVSPGTICRQCTIRFEFVTWTMISYVHRQYLWPTTQATLGNICCAEVYGVSRSFTSSLLYYRYIDPTLEHDLTSQNKPWALSPLIATMPHFQLSDATDKSRFPPETSIIDHPSPEYKLSKKSRRSYYSTTSHRQEVSYEPKVRGLLPCFADKPRTLLRPTFATAF